MFAHDILDYKYLQGYIIGIILRNPKYDEYNSF